MAKWQPGLFALPCGADFAAGFAEGLIARMADQPPEAMARAPAKSSCASPGLACAIPT